MFSFERFYDIVSTCRDPQDFFENLGIDSRNFDNDDIIQIVDSIDQNRNYEVNVEEALLIIRKSDNVRKL